ncbi:MAG: hypothetical protein K2X03_31410 [Bryobacteraceae bacterium]|nr:hypothetical protein [Bryobacteraceae bacterium]
MFYVATIALLAMAFWIIVFRFTGKPESNWPLIFWGFAAAHVQTFEILNPYLVLLGVIAALFLRFEFMGRAFVRFFIFLELPALCYVAWATLNTLV